MVPRRWRNQRCPGKRTSVVSATCQLTAGRFSRRRRERCDSGWKFSGERLECRQRCLRRTVNARHDASGAARRRTHSLALRAASRPSIADHARRALRRFVSISAREVERRRWNAHRPAVSRWADPLVRPRTRLTFSVALFLRVAAGGELNSPSDRFGELGERTAGRYNEDTACRANATRSGVAGFSRPRRTPPTRMIGYAATEN